MSGNQGSVIAWLGARGTRVSRAGPGRPADQASRPGVLWAVPAVVFFLGFAVLPLVLVVWLSFTNWNALGTPRPAGLSNWTRLLADPQARAALRLSVVLTVAAWVTQTPVAMLLGVWAAGRQRSRAVLSSIFFLPLLLSTAAIAVVWQALLDPNFGIPGWLGPTLGLTSTNVLGSPTFALWAVVFVVGWQFVPFHTLLYQAGARQVPQMLYDAATIDGAGRVAQFFRITLPQLKNTIITSSVVMIVGSLTFFDTVLILTNGGPGTDTTILPFYMYTTGFKSYEMGYAAAIGVCLVVLGTAVSLLVVRFSGFGKMRSTLEGL